jgi:hypothetical protein
MNLRAASLPTNGERDIQIARLINHRLGNIGLQSGVVANGDQEMYDDDEDVGMEDYSDDGTDDSDDDDDTSSSPSDNDPERIFSDVTNAFANLSSFTTNFPTSQQTPAAMHLANQTPKQTRFPDLVVVFL